MKGAPEPNRARRPGGWDALADATAHGGHLLEARVRPTLELVIVESPDHLQRTVDPATGLALLRL
jgi:uncharacterized protein